MKRSIIGIAIFVVVLIGAIAATPLFISSDAVRQRITSKVQEITGLTMSFTGNPSVSFSPFLGIEITDIVLRDPNEAITEAPILRAQRLQGKLNFLSAFFGKPDLDVFRLIEPELNLIVNRSGESNWRFKNGLLSKRVQQIIASRDEQSASTDGEDVQAAAVGGKAISVNLGRFEIVDGTVTYTDAIDGTEETFSRITGTITWPGTNSAMEVLGTLLWREEAVSVNSTITDPMSLVSGGVSITSISSRSDFFELNYGGQVNTIADFLLNGSLSLTVSDPSAYARFLAIDLMEGSDVPPFFIEGQLDGKPQQYQLNNATVRLGSDVATGSVQLKLGEDGDTVLGGTLAFDEIDATPFVLETVSRITAQPNYGNLIASPEGMRFDFRVSASELRIGQIAVSEFAAALQGGGSEWLLDVGTARVFNGDLLGKVSTLEINGVPGFKIDLSGNDLSSEQVMALFPTSALKLAGDMRLNLAIQSSAPSQRGLLRNLDGKLDFRVQNGSLSGINYSEIISNLKSGKQADDFLSQRAQTQFDLLSFDILINRGVGWLSDGQLRTGDQQLAITGKADFFLGGLAAQAELMDAPEENTEGPVVGENANGTGQPKLISRKNRLFVGGSFSSPLITSLPFPENVFPPSVVEDPAPQEENPPKAPGASN